MTFTLPAPLLEKACNALEKHRDEIGYEALQADKEFAKISIIGVGMRSHAGVAAKAFSALAEKAINIRAISTSEIKISILIDTAYTELAVRTLHAAYGLDQEDAA